MQRQIVSTKYNNYCYNIFIIIGINYNIGRQHCKLIVLSLHKY